MNKPHLFLSSLCLAIFTSTASAASTVGLWGGAADFPPDTLKVPTQQLNDGSFRYMPMHPVHFNSDKATLTHQGQLALDAAVEYIDQHQDIKRIVIEGHTDWVGSAEYNDNLSDRRSEIVRNYLTIKGVNPLIIATSSKGEHAPVDINWSREGRQRNRQVSLYAIHWDR